MFIRILVITGLFNLVSLLSPIYAQDGSILNETMKGKKSQGLLRENGSINSDDAFNRDETAKAKEFTPQGMMNDIDPSGNTKSETIENLKVEDYLGAFGAAADSKGKIIFPDAKKIKKPVLINTMVMHGMDAEIRNMLYQKEKCGPRAYQVVIAELGSKENASATDALGVIYKCDGFCGGIREQRSKDKKTLRISTVQELPSSLCEGLWNGAVPLDDTNGL